MAREEEQQVTRFVVEATLIALLILTAAGGLAFWKGPVKRELDYSGTCGRFRECETRLWGLSHRCEILPHAPGNLRAFQLKPFAPESQCSDWYAAQVDGYASFDIALATGAADGMFSLMLINDVQQEMRALGRPFLTEDSRLVKDADAMSRAYRRADCAGYTNHFEATSFTAVVAANLDNDPELDCWLLTDEGELRHIQRDR